MQVDALIIGAGPAGTSCALGLAQRGWRVVIIDRSTFPRHKTCGGFIGPENKLLLMDLGIWSRLLEEGACVVERSVITSSKGASTFIPIDGSALGVSRKLLDKLLLDRVKKMGIDVYEAAQVRSIYNNGKGFDVSIDHYGANKIFNLRARHIIDASGQHPPSVKPIKIQFGLAAMYEGITQSAQCVMLHCCQGGHVGINPFENGQVNVCYVVDSGHFKSHGSNADQVLSEWIKESYHLQRLMIGAKRVTTWKAIHIPMRDSIVLFENNIWRVGNSAAFIDTATGGGISVALQSGQILARALSEHVQDKDILRQYTEHYLQHFSKQRRVASLFGRFAHYPWAAEMIIRLLDSNNLLRQAAMGHARPGNDAKIKYEIMKDKFSGIKIKKGAFSEV